MAEDSLIRKISITLNNLEIPLDLTLVIIWLTACLAVVYLSIPELTTLSYAIIIPLVLIIPGYCLIASLFPKEGDIGLFERIALSFPLSIVIFLLIVLGLNFTQGVTPRALIVIVLVTLSLVMVLISYIRRKSLKPEDRFRMPFSAIGIRFYRAIFPGETDILDKILSIILILVILFATITVFYVIASPKENEHFSEFYILGEKQMTAEYPDRIIPGQDYSIYVGVGNYEYRNVRYTIETWMLLTEFDNVTNSSRILAGEPIDMLSITLAHNETRLIPYNLSVKKRGYNRIEFLLFNETVPDLDIQGSDRINESYRDLHLMVTVQ